MAAGRSRFRAGADLAVHRLGQLSGAVNAGTFLFMTTKRDEVK
jgi:hypothetical protein